MNDNNALKKIKAGKFIKNNGLVLRTINILRYKFEKLKKIRYALDDISENEYLDSLNYLFESEYIQLRHCRSKQSAELADMDIADLEAKLTDKGIKLLAGKIWDELIRCNLWQENEEQSVQ